MGKSLQAGLRSLRGGGGEFQGGGATAGHLTQGARCLSEGPPQSVYLALSHSLSHTLTQPSGRCSWHSRSAWVGTWDSMAPKWVCRLPWCLVHEGCSVKLGLGEQTRAGRMRSERRPRQLSG